MCSAVQGNAKPSVSVGQPSHLKLTRMDSVSINSGGIQPTKLLIPAHTHKYWFKVFGVRWSKWEGRYKKTFARRQMELHPKQNRFGSVRFNGNWFRRRVCLLSQEGKRQTFTVFFGQPIESLQFWNHTKWCRKYSLLGIKVDRFALLCFALCWFALRVVRKKHMFTHSIRVTNIFD